MKKINTNTGKNILMLMLVCFLLVNTRFFGQDQSNLQNDGGILKSQTNEKADKLNPKIWPIISMYDFNLKVEASNTIDKIEMTVLDEYGAEVYDVYFIPSQKHDTIYKFGGNFDSGQYFVRLVQNDKVHYQSLVRR